MKFAFEHFLRSGPGHASAGEAETAVLSIRPADSTKNLIVKAEQLTDGRVRIGWTLNDENGNQQITGGQVTVDP